MPEETKEQRAAYVAGLVRERDAAVARGDDVNVEEIDVELRRMGHGAKAPAQRAETREEKKAPADTTKGKAA